MKRVLSLLLTVALVLSCLVTGTAFSASAASIRYLTATDVVGTSNGLGLKWCTNGGTQTDGALDTVKTQFVQDKVNYVDYGYETVTANYDGAYVITSKAEEVFINNTASPESFRYKPQTPLSITNTSSAMFYAEVPKYRNQSGQDWGLGFYGITVANSTGASRYLNITENLTNCLYYLPLGETVWKAATIYPSGNGVRICKTNIPTGFKGYIRIDFSKLPMKNSLGDSYTDFAQLVEIDVAYNCVSQTDPFVLGGLMYAVQSWSDADGSILKIGTNTYSISRRAALEGKKVLAISGQTASDAWAHYVNGASNQTAASYQASYTKNTTVHKEPGEEYISAYPNGTDAAYTYAGSYVFSAKGEKVQNSLTNPEYFLFTANLKVANTNSVLVYVEVPDYAAAGETWGFGLQRLIFKDSTGQNFRSFSYNEELTTGLQYIDENGNWTNATIYARGAGEAINKTNIPSGYKGYICIDLPNLDTQGSTYDGKTLWGNKTKDYVALDKLAIAYNGLTAGDNFVVGGLFYTTTNTDLTVLNFGYESYVDLAKDTSKYITVEGLSGQNWSLGNKQGINGAGKAATDGSIKTNMAVDRTVYTDLGAKYASYYINNWQDYSYSGARVFTPKTADTTFVNDTANVEHYIWQAKLDLEKDDTMMFYVEVPDYVTAGEEWGLGFQSMIFKGQAWGTTGVLLDTADITEGFSYLSIYGNKWENGTIYAKEAGENLVKTDLPAGFKGYVRFDTSKLPIVYQNTTSACNNFVYLYTLNIAYNAVSTNDPFVLGDLIYRTDNVDGTVLNFNGVGYETLVQDSPDHIKVLGMAGYNYGIETTRLKKISDTDVNGVTATATSYDRGVKTGHQEIGIPYMSLYNLGAEVADPTNSELVAKCYGVYEIKSASGTYISETATPEAFLYQSKLTVTSDNAIIVYVDLPDYKANGADWGFGLARRGDGSKSWVAEFNNSNTNARYFKRTADNTTGFSYLAEGDDEWVSGTVYAETGRVMKTDLPSGFKGYVRFDLSKFNYVNGNGDDVAADITKLVELNFAYNGVTESDTLTIGGLMYVTTANDGKVFKFKDSSYAPIVSNTMSVRAQNLITDTANETNATGTNIKLGKFDNTGALVEALTTAEMQLTKSGGLFLDDGYAAAFIPSTQKGTNVLLGGTTHHLNYIVDENLGLKLKSGVNKLMVYVELPDVRDLNNVTDDSKALAFRAFTINGNYVPLIGYENQLTYQFMDIREGVWQEGTISDGSADEGKSAGALLGLPTDGFKGYIKIDLSSILGGNEYTVEKIQLGINRTSWGRKLVIGGFYAVDVDNTDSTAYFMDSETGEMATTNVVAGDFSCDEEYNTADLALAIKYLIKADSVTGAQTARASSFDNYKADFTVVSLVQLKKILSGLPIGFSIDKDLEASTSEADAIITAQNPDRGFRMKTFISADEEYCPTWNLTQWWDKFAKAADETNPGVWVEPTVTKIYLPLANYYDRDITDEDVIYKNMQTAFDIVRKQGKTTIIRFWYEDYYADITNDQMLAHIAQIKANGILERNKDVIHAVEAGFLGKYGEWHAYYDDFWSDANKLPDGTLNVDKVWAMEGYNEEAIIAAVLDMVPAEIPVLLREATYRDKFLASDYANEGDEKRLGIHLDSYYGLYEAGDKVLTTTNPASAQAAAEVAPMSGEFYWGAEFNNPENDYYGTRVSGEKAILGFKYYRQNTFSVFHNSWEGTETVANVSDDPQNPSYVYGYTDREGDMAQWAKTEITEEWLQANNVFYAPSWFKDAEGSTVERTQFEFVRDYLGYRLEAKHLKVTGSKARGGKVNVEIDLVNYGFSAPYQMTSELVVLDSNNKIVSRVDAGDALDWVNTDDELVTHKINATITLPETSGKYKIALYVHNRAGTGAYLANNIEQVDGFNILATFGIQ